MRTLFLAATAALLASPTPAMAKVPVGKAAAPPGTNCDWDLSHMATNTGKRLLLRKLTELPPAKGYYAVVHQVNGCPSPVLVSDRIPARP